jgi:manganese-dependent inorganic pyrophosphatase
VNPDTDGVCSAIGYEYLALVTTRKEYLPIVFGTLNRETALVLRYFQEKDPIVRTAIPPDSSIVLVDTHHVDQLPPNIPFHNVLEIMDHHPGGNPEAFPNAVIQNENVGAVATLITERIQEAAFIPPPKICGLLAAAIISNTLNFSAPSTCERDNIAFRWLQKQVTIDDKFIHEMFKARSDVAHETTLHVLTSDLKVFTISHVKIAIAQLETVDLMNFIARHDMLEALSELKHKLGVHHCIFNGVDIIKRASVVATTSDETKTLLTKALGAKFTGYSAEFSRILLRKTDFIPALEKFLKKER